jgi:hypothetical protein
MIATPKKETGIIVGNVFLAKDIVNLTGISLTTLVQLKYTTDTGRSSEGIHQLDTAPLTWEPILNGAIEQFRIMLALQGEACGQEVGRISSIIYNQTGVFPCTRTMLVTRLQSTPESTHAFEAVIPAIGRGSSPFRARVMLK